MAPTLLPFRVMMRENGYQGYLTITAQSGTVGRVDDDTSRKNISETVGIKSDGLLLPMDQVVAGRMPPVHWPPNDIFGIILKEKMIGALIIDKTIGIVRPFFTRREMKAWPVLFMPRLTPANTGSKQ